MEFLNISLKKRVLNELPTSFVENLALFSYHTKTLKVIMLSKTVAPAHIKWHFENHVKDKLIRNPTNYEAWKAFDKIHKSFASNPRNVR